MEGAAWRDTIRCKSIAHVHGLPLMYSLVDRIQGPAELKQQ